MVFVLLIIAAAVAALAGLLSLADTAGPLYGRINLLAVACACAFAGLAIGFYVV